MSRKTLTRRQFVAATAMSSAALISAPYVRGAYAAGKLSIGFWDHWVPGANAASTALVNEWAAKEKVEVSIDYITSNNKKLELTVAAEAQAKSGHDILQMPTWWPHAYAEQLESVSDIMEPIVKQNGEVNGTTKYLGQSGGKWLAVPATVGSQIKGPCSRIDLMKKHAGIDVQEMYPAGSTPKDENWTMDVFLKAAEACHKAGFPFGIGLGETTDSVDTAGAIFQSFGAELVNAKGDITVKSDNVRQALEFYKKLIAVLPADAPSWDDASNNKWLISGRGALILNPPSLVGRCQTRRPASRRAMLDARHAGRSEGPLRTVPAVFLGRLGLRQEQGSRQEPADPSVAAIGHRKVRRGERRLRSPGFREHDEAEDVGRGRAAEGHAL